MEPPAFTVPAPAPRFIWACPLGFGLLLAFNVMLSFMGSRLPAVDAGCTFLVIQRLVEAGTYLAGALFAKRLFGLERRRPLVWGCAAACIAGCLAVGLSLTGALSQAALATHVVFSLVKGVPRPCSGYAGSASTHVWTCATCCCTTCWPT